jgi:hypothetical protein
MVGDDPMGPVGVLAALGLGLEPEELEERPAADGGQEVVGGVLELGGEVLLALDPGSNEPGQNIPTPWFRGVQVLPVGVTEVEVMGLVGRGDEPELSALAGWRSHL